MCGAERTPLGSHKAHANVSTGNMFSVLSNVHGGGWVTGGGRGGRCVCVCVVRTQHTFMVTLYASTSACQIQPESVRT